MVYSTRYDKSADRQISDRTNRPPPDLFVPGRDLRYRPGLQQYRGMVVVDSRGGPAAQGSAVLSSAGREFGIRIRRLRLRAEPVARRFRRTDPAFAGRRDLRQGQIGRLSPAQSLAELEPNRFQRKRRPARAPLCLSIEAKLTSPPDWRTRACRRGGLARAPCGGCRAFFLVFSFCFFLF